MVVNLASSSVTVMPVGSTRKRPVVTNHRRRDSKAPRPPNAFIIYRREWHPKIVAQNPTLHNNAISVIIGNKWRAESDDVRNKYKSKAEDAKRQHELDYPGYQYRPRKPSEMKRRRPRKKLAEQTERVNEKEGHNATMRWLLPDNFHHMTTLDENFRPYIDGQPSQVANFEIQHGANAPCSDPAISSQAMGFDVVQISGTTPCAQLEDLDGLHHPLRQQNGTMDVQGAADIFDSTAVSCQSAVSGSFLEETMRFDLPWLNSNEDINVNGCRGAACAASAARYADIDDPYTEAEYQDLLSLDFDQFIVTNLYENSMGNIDVNSSVNDAKGRSVTMDVPFSMNEGWGAKLY